VKQLTAALVQLPSATQHQDQPVPQCHPQQPQWHQLMIDIPVHLEGQMQSLQPVSQEPAEHAALSCPSTTAHD